MALITEYKVITGNKESFEKQLNETDNTWIWCCNVDTTIIQNEIQYSTILSKSTQKD